MRLMHNPERTEPCVLVLGMFDGVHRGHQALFLRARELAARDALPVTVCTFEPHPLAVIRPELSPERLTTPLERAQWMGLCGVDRVCVHDFTREVADREPEAFLERIRAIYRPAAIICGYNYTFGRRGAGNGDLLTAWAKEKAIRAEVVPAVEIGGEPVSSTRIRGLLSRGDVGEAARLLGHAYTLAGPVVHGKGLGHTLGFPTANVGVPAGKVLPAFGVYACGLTVGDRTLRAMVNVGRQPTLPSGGVTVEANILGENPDLYGQTVRVTFLRRLRGERPFPDSDALVRQLTCDRAQTEAFFRGAEEWKMPE